MALQSINPKNGEVFSEIDVLDDASIKDRITKSQSAYEQWSRLGFDERAKYLNKTAEVLRRKKSELAKIITDEMGKTLVAAEAEVEKCAGVCEYYAQNASTFLAPEHIDVDSGKAYARFDPIGIVLAVMPWNFPFWQVFRFAAPALMAGNVGLLKHASNVALSAQAIEDVFLEAGLPEGVFYNLPIETQKVESIIRDDRVKAVTLTGSERAGMAVAGTAGQEIKKSVMELGGSDPFIVLADADLDKAAQVAVSARMQFNAGQSCIAAKRFIIEKPVFDQFVEKVKFEVAKLKIGDPLDSATTVGPMANKKMFDEIKAQVERSVEAGAKVIAGGKSWGETGYYYEPTVLVDVNPDMPAMAEELFGPVMPIIAVDSVDQAIELANSSIYGLGGSVFTADQQKAEEIASRLDTGCVFINSHIKSDPKVPFGGVKKSGYGRELSHYGIKEFVNIKSVCIG
ncbi:MAG: NAD-dependent succinate-semialdehyde dehydrogenase [Patescibacteria group bacterium]